MGEAVEEYAVTLGLLERREGVESAELGPGDGDHLGGGVEFHGAGSRAGSWSGRERDPGFCSLVM